MLHDIRAGFRSLWQHRGVSALAIICLGLGVGLNATMFSVVDGVLIQSLPYRQADRILAVYSSKPKANINRAGVSYADFKDVRDASRSFETIAATQGRSLTLSDGSGEPERFAGGAVSWDLFSMLGVQPILGRAFRAEDDVPGAEPVVMLGHMVWTRRYNANPGVINQRVLLNARPHTIIGVMPPNFAFPENQKLWVTLAPVASPARSARGLGVYGRLHSGVTLDQASSDLATVSTQLAASFPDSNLDWDVRARTLRDQFIPDDVSLVLLLMMGGSALVLVIACANVANLLLARATVRRREMAIRASLGAGKWRMIRQMLAESALLGIISVPLSLGIAFIGTALLRAGIPPDDIPYYVQWRVDWRTTLYAAGVAVSTALLFGLLPALQASSGTLHASLKESGRGNSRGRSWLRNALVSIEVAMALTALVGAMLFVRTFVNLNKADIGFDPAPLMTMRYYMPGGPYDVPDAKLRRVRDILERVERLPGVQSAYSSNFIPLDGGGSGGTVAIEGKAVEAADRPSIAFVGVTPGFVKTIGARLEQGRLLTDTESWSRTPYAVINQTMAQELLTGGDPLGRRFKIDGNDIDEWFTVVGVISNVQHEEIDDAEPIGPAAYVPLAYQQTVSTGLVLRVAGDPASITPAVRDAIRAADPNIPLAFVRTMDEVRRLTFWQFQLFGSVFSTIGGLGLLLAAVGVYGVLSYTVSQRRQEIGVMVALGASRRNVLELVVGQGLRLAGVGVLLGLVGAAGAGKAAESLLFNVSPFDPISFIGVSAFLMIVALLASVIPARRATKVDPIIALRAE
ncbi:MAG: ABC transporter permease [Acidobacteriota bacterium]|nr:ABC transporter permease [Acidobacteriota bacterium]